MTSTPDYKGTIVFKKFASPVFKILSSYNEAAVVSVSEP